MRILIVGCGYVGLPLGAELVSVIVAALKSGRPGEVYNAVDD